MVARMGWGFSREALRDLTDRAADAETVEALRVLIAATPGVQGVHDLKTRKMGDMILG